MIMNDLYYIENQGCDATTYGLARISEEDFPKFKTFIENLNKNSHYGCMPVIHVYRIDMNDIKEFNYNSALDCWDDEYVDKSDIFYLDKKTYTFRDMNSRYADREQVI